MTTTKKEPPFWRVTLPDRRTFRVQAYTAGEARAGAKTHFGLSRRGRLPVGTTTERET